MNRICMLALVLVVAGCIYVPPVWNIGAEIDELDFIEPGVTTKDQVLAELGDPGTSYDEGVESGFIYSGHKSGGGIIVGYGAAEIEPTSWTVAIIFDENDLVRQVSISEVPEVPSVGDRHATLLEKAEYARLKPKAEYSRLKAKADAGDLAAQYEISSRETDPSERYRWLCLAAHQSHAKAQHKIARLYQRGDPPTEEDLVRAYLWYGLAERNGLQKRAFAYVRTDSSWQYKEFKNHRVWVKTLMTPNQTSEAERLVAEWTPDPEECDRSGALSTN